MVNKMDEKEWQYSNEGNEQNIERSYALAKILSKSKNLRATLKFKYLVNKLEKSFCNKKFKQI